MAPDSKIWMGLPSGPSLSTIAGILLFGLIFKELGVELIALLANIDWDYAVGERKLFQRDSNLVPVGSWQEIHVNHLNALPRRYAAKSIVEFTINRYDQVGLKPFSDVPGNFFARVLLYEVSCPFNDPEVAQRCGRSLSGSGSNFPSTGSASPQGSNTGRVRAA